MRLSVRRSVPTLLLLGAAVAVLSCGDVLGPNGEKLVAVEDDAFNPATKTVNVGDAVLWQWKGGNQHNVTWVTQSGAGNSATQSSGTYSRTFSTVGTYDYFCSIHATFGMRGTIIVHEVP